ncbi:hypothetical protein O6H91_21G061000 [Diphasiastrum complanatum]|nr:hypothetical protein O6H91_21G061000 [Diphasiastrum complanatum]
MRGEEARKACPDIHLVQVPVAHDKADLKLYRDAGSEVCAILARMGKCERASIDEVYLDITEAATARLIQDPPQCWVSLDKEALKSHVVGLATDGDATVEVGHWLQRKDAEQNDQLLACGAAIIAELRTAVLSETQFTCSAGIAHNKMLAKLASGMHKPAQQTIVPSSAVQGLLTDLPINKIGQLGGKLGHLLEVELGVKTAGDLLQFSEAKLQDLFGMNTGTWLWRTARGINGDEVQGRMLPKSHSSGKTFPGPKSLKDLSAVGHWVRELAEVLQERLDMDIEQNNRIARLLTLHAGCHLHSSGADHARKFPSQSCALRYGKEKIADDANRLFEKALRKFCPTLNLSPRKKGSTASFPWRVTGISLSASNIVATPMGVDRITRFFGSSAQPIQVSSADKSSFSDPTSPASSFETSISGESSVLGSASMHTQELIDALDTTHFSTSLVYAEDSQQHSKGKEVHASKLAGKTDVDSLAPSSCVDIGGNALNAAGMEAGSLVDDDGGDMRLNVQSGGLEKSFSQCTFRFPSSNESEGGNDGDTCTPSFGPVNSFDAFDESLLLSKQTFSSIFNLQQQATPIQKREPEALEAADLIVISCSPVDLVEDCSNCGETTSLIAAPGTLHANESCKEAIKDGHRMVADASLRHDQLSSANELCQDNLIGSTGGESFEPCMRVSKGCRQQGMGRLMDFWQHKLGNNPTEAGSSQKDIVAQYKLEEIDESVLAELPADIRLEFQNLLRIKRRRALKRSTIGDFFKR